jgi:hypothetical protein
MNFIQRVGCKVLGIETLESRIKQSARATDAQLDVLREELSSALLELAAEDEGWDNLGEASGQMFSRAFQVRQSQLARLMFIKNPLIKRGMQIQAQYVWGRGVDIEAKNADVNKALQTFIDDADNKKEITSHGAQLEKEIELQADGNNFFTFFPNARTGHVKVSSFPHSECTEIVTDPENKKKPWFYKREWTVETTDLKTGRRVTQKKVLYYPDWKYAPLSKPRSIGSVHIDWTSPVFHVKSGLFSDQLFGLSEIVAAIPWGKAYTEFLEDRASVARALSVFAWKATGEKGAKGLARLKQKLGQLSTAATDATGANVPVGTGGFRTASTIAVTKGNEIEPIKTGGATINPEEGRRFLLMIAAAFGVPETFFGDVSVGTLATAKSLNRPTEIMMVNRQIFWQAVLLEIFNFVIDWSIRAPQGQLSGQVTINDAGERQIKLDGDENARHIEITFPNVVEPDIPGDVEAITTAAKFLPDARLVARLLLSALGVDDLDTVLDDMFEKDGTPKNPPLVAPDADPDADEKQGNDKGKAKPPKAKTKNRESASDEDCRCTACQKQNVKEAKAKIAVHVEPGTLDPMSEDDLAAALTFTATDIAEALALAGDGMRELLTAQPDTAAVSSDKTETA